MSTSPCLCFYPRFWTAKGKWETEVWWWGSSKDNWSCAGQTKERVCFYFFRTFWTDVSLLVSHFELWSPNQIFWRSQSTLWTQYSSCWEFCIVSCPLEFVFFLFQFYEGITEPALQHDHTASDPTSYWAGPRGVDDVKWLREIWNGLFFFGSYRFLNKNSL